MKKGRQENLIFIFWIFAAKCGWPKHQKRKGATGTVVLPRTKRRHFFLTISKTLSSDKKILEYASFSQSGQDKINGRQTWWPKVVGGKGGVLNFSYELPDIWPMALLKLETQLCVERSVSKSEQTSETSDSDLLSEAGAYPVPEMRFSSYSLCTFCSKDLSTSLENKQNSSDNFCGFLTGFRSGITEYPNHPSHKIHLCFLSCFPWSFSALRSFRVFTSVLFAWNAHWGFRNRNVPTCVEKVMMTLLYWSKRVIAEIVWDIIAFAFTPLRGVILGVLSSRTSQ